jgi:16S rRNA (cytosine967-C5)-methyltransferase
VDAPCTNLGVIRRRPDLKWSKGPEDVTRLAGIQLKLLAAAAGQVRPGGRLIYGVCSFSLAEGPETTAKFLEARPEFKAPPPAAWPETLRPHLEGGHLTLWPHRHQTDGFFWALFERTGG